jgi:hypothetical protein
MSPKEITERCQEAIEAASISDFKLQGINRVNNGIRVRCETENQAIQLRALNWSKAFEGVKIHKLNYLIVIHGVPVNDINATDNKAIGQVEATNNMQHRTITKVVPLRKNKEPPSDARHRSIVIHLNNLHTANKCIENGLYINYVYPLLRSMLHTTIPNCTMPELL